MTRMVANLNKITWKLQSLELANLTDYSKNPRTLSEKEFKQLKLRGCGDPAVGGRDRTGACDT